MNKCLNLFPFEISHVLTDNRLEFTYRFNKSQKGNCQKPSKFNAVYEGNNIKHRLTKPHKSKTNGMVERVNGSVKKGTILKEEYKHKEDMSQSLITFLLHYNFLKRHEVLRKELNVKTPFLSIEKWLDLKPEVFKLTPGNFKFEIY